MRSLSRRASLGALINAAVRGLRTLRRFSWPAAAQGRLACETAKATMSELVETTLRYCSPLDESGRSPALPKRRSARRCCRPRCPVPRHGRSL